MAEYDETLSQIAQALGHAFTDLRLLTDALTHSSYRNEKPTEVRSDNERLEFLGDAVLQWVVSALLWEHFPAASAGEMTRRRADLVCEEGLSRVALEVGLGSGLRLGKGEERSGGRHKPRLLASALEACVAAVYLDAGTDAALRVCRQLFTRTIAERVPGARDFKTRLQEFLQGSGRKLPAYEITSTTGPDHARHYHVTITVEGAALAQGAGRSKLEAEQSAAERALSVLANEPQTKG
ncbi:MAG TPA: ribonuclease III [Polyangiales bacterium]|nr:ribonuclease III [Polyangiales bacterium]